MQVPILVPDDTCLVGHTPKITYAHVICWKHPSTPCHLSTCHLLDGPSNVFDVCSVFLSTHQRHWKVHRADDMCSLLFAFCWLLFHFQIPFQKLLICSYISLLPEISFFFWLLFPFQIPLKSILKRIDLLFFFTFW